MCAPIGDGSVAAILCSGDTVRKLGLTSQAVKIKASVLGSAIRTSFDSDIPEIGERLSREAYEKAGVGPQDINVAEVHDASASVKLFRPRISVFVPKAKEASLPKKGRQASRPHSHQPQRGPDFTGASHRRVRSGLRYTNWLRS